MIVNSLKKIKQPQLPCFQQGVLLGRNVNQSRDFHQKININTPRITNLRKELNEYRPVVSTEKLKALSILKKDVSKLVIYYTGIKDVLDELVLHPAPIPFPIYEKYVDSLDTCKKILDLITEYDSLGEEYKVRNQSLFIDASNQVFFGIPPKKPSYHKRFEKASYSFDVPIFAPSVAQLFEEAARITKEQSNPNANKE